MAGSIKGILVEIGGDTSGLQKALKKVNSETSGLSKELKGITDGVVKRECIDCVRDAAALLERELQ